MAREKQFTFIPEEQLTEKRLKERHPAVSIKVSGAMHFNSAAIEEYGLNNRYVRFYADPDKKALAWHIFDGANNLEDLNLKHLKKNNAGTMVVGVGRILKKIGVNIKETIKDLLIQKYEDLMERKAFFYVIVRETNTKEPEREPSIFDHPGRPRKDKTNGIFKS